MPWREKAAPNVQAPHSRLLGTPGQRGNLRNPDTGRCSVSRLENATSAVLLLALSLAITLKAASLTGAAACTQTQNPNTTAANATAHSSPYRHSDGDNAQTAAHTTNGSSNPANNR